MPSLKDQITIMLVVIGGFLTVTLLVILTLKIMYVFKKDSDRRMIIINANIENVLAQKLKSNELEEKIDDKLDEIINMKLISKEVENRITEKLDVILGILNKN